MFSYCFTFHLWNSFYVNVSHQCNCSSDLNKVNKGYKMINVGVATLI